MAREVRVTCSSKSHRANSPDSSSTRRSCTSPRAPRTEEALSAVARGGGLRPERLRRPADCGEALAQLTELLHPIAFQRADLPLDPADRVPSGARRAAASADSARQLEVLQAHPQQVSLGLCGRRPRQEEPRTQRKAMNPPRTSPTTRPPNNAAVSMAQPWQSAPTAPGRPRRRGRLLDTLPVSEYDEAIRLEPGDTPATRHGAFSESWMIGNAVNGGVDGGWADGPGQHLSHAPAETTHHVDPVVLSAYFMTAATPGPFTAVTEMMRPGRRLSTGQISIAQDVEGQSIERMRAIASFGNLEDVDTHRQSKPPDLPPPDSACRRTTHHQTSCSTAASSTASTSASTRPPRVGPSASRRCEG